MATIADTAAVDPAQTIVRLADGLIVQPQIYGSKTFYHLQWAAEEKYYRIGYEEYVFLSLLDGRTSFTEALARTTQALTTEDDCRSFEDTALSNALPTDSVPTDSGKSVSTNVFTQQRAMDLYRWLLQSGLATICDEWSDRRKQQSAKTPSLLQRFNPLWLKIPLGDPQKLLNFVHPMVGWIFSPLATVLGCMLMVAAAFQLWFHWAQFQAASGTVLAPDNWLWLLIAWVSLKVLHETAHGLTCVRYGGTVSKTGIILAVLAPLAWIDLSSSWKFSSRWQRIHTAAAGMYVEFLVAAIAIFAFDRVENPVLTHLLFNVIFMASVTTILFNANPLMKFDGYFILSDLLQVPNLAQEAQTCLKNKRNRILCGIRSSQPTMEGRATWFLLLYGFLAAIWKVLICASLLLAASVLFHGAGIALVALALVGWVGQPLWKQAQGLHQMWQHHRLRVIRGTVLAGGTVSLLIFTVFSLPAPFPATSPGVVSLPEGSSVRVNVDGFVDEILVESGQQVEQGAPLFVLKNSEVSNNFQDLKLQILQEETRLQIAMDEKDPAEAGLSRKKIDFLKMRFHQVQERFDSLVVTAKSDGTVVGDQLPDLQDRHLKEGEVICRIDDRGPREFRLSVDQFDFSIAEDIVGRSVPIRLGTRALMTGEMRRVIPRASRRLMSPALAAHSGGPLAVKPVSDDNDRETLQLTEQRFEAVVVLKAGKVNPLPVGERGYAVLGHSDRTIASWAYHSARTWVARTLDAATVTR